MQIIEKCDGLPLAVKVMGGLLRTKGVTHNEWVKVLNNSKWSVSQMPEELNTAIEISYDDLNPFLKQCFLHYSLLPKIILLDVSAVVSMWISEGFVHGNSNKLEELGYEYHEDLVSRNLIDPHTRFAYNSSYTMHDVVRSFAQYMARNEALVRHAGDSDLSDKLDKQSFHRLSLYSTTGPESNDLEWSCLQAQQSLITLLSFGSLTFKPGDHWVNFSNLRTLHLQSSNCGALVGSLHKLKFLRYLSMEKCGISILPEKIGKMGLLQFINIQGNQRLVKLPKNFVRLRQLRFLNIGATSINNIPRGFHVLTNLRELRGLKAHMDGDWCTLEVLEALPLLTLLGVDSLENVSTSSYAKKARLNKKQDLRNLTLACTSTPGGRSSKAQQVIREVFDELSPPPGLESLMIYGYFGQKLPSWMMVTAVALKSLRYVSLGDLPCCTELPDGLCQLPCLDVLQIKLAPCIRRVGQEFQGRPCQQSQVMGMFPRLRKLVFVEMVEWEEWEWDCNDEVQVMPVLEELRLDRCKLRCIPPGLAFHATALSHLLIDNVKNLSSIEDIASLVNLWVTKCPDLTSISNLHSLQKLEIHECPKLRVVQGLPALERLKLHSMESLPGYLRHVTPRQLWVDCSLPLFQSIEKGDNPEWKKVSHIPRVSLVVTRGPSNFETNIVSGSAAQGNFYLHSR